MVAWLSGLPWALVIIACLTLGLSPFVPEPHVWEKLRMLVHGKLVKPIDWFDLVMHGAPWVVLVAKSVVTAMVRGGG